MRCAHAAFQFSWCRRERRHVRRRCRRNAGRVGRDSRRPRTLARRSGRALSIPVAYSLLAEAVLGHREEDGDLEDLEGQDRGDLRGDEAPAGQRGATEALEDPVAPLERGDDPEADEAAGGQYLHVGIAQRGFERRFELADYVRVADANLEDGLLTIDLVREVPEAMKPKKIAVGTQRSLSVVPGAADDDSQAA